MALNYISIAKPGEQEQIKQDNFVANQVYPICIKESQSEIRNVFAILFYAKQNYNDSNLFFNIFFQVDDNIDIDMITKNTLYFGNIKKDTKKLSIYKDAIKSLSKDNFYSSDLRMKRDPDHGTYYQTSMIGAYDDSTYLLDVFFPLEVYLRLKIFLNKIASLEQDAELVCIDPKYNNIKYDKIETIVYDCSSRLSDNTIISHYKMNCGPSTYEMNHIVSVDPKYYDKLLANPLISSLYMKFYQYHPFVTDIVEEDDNTYWIIYNIADQSTDNKLSTRALMLTKDLINKTNLLDPYNRLFAD